MSGDTMKTSASLLGRVRNLNNEDSWRQFVKIYEPLLYRYGRLRGLSREDASELTQACMARLVEVMPDFEYSPGRATFKTWLRRLAHHKIIDMWRSRRRAGGAPDTLGDREDPDAETDAIWEDQWQRKHLRYCLTKVLEEAAPVTRRAFELYVISEWPVERVAETLQVSVDQVYASKSRIKQRLKREYDRLMSQDLSQRGTA